MLPVIFNVVLPDVPVRVSVAAKMFVVVTAFDTYRFDAVTFVKFDTP
jgi:hypothetical protein